MSASTPPRRLLNVIRVETPCPADWRSMRGDDRSRFCEHCRRHVHDLSAMTEDEATRLVCREAGSLCVRFSRDAAGNLMTLDYQRAPPRRRGWRFWGLVGTGAAAACWAVSLFAGTSRRPPVVGGAVLMGAPMPMTMPSTQPSPGGPGSACGVPATNPAPADDAGSGE